MPSVAFTDQHDVDAIAETITTTTLVPLFRKLHPEPSGWNLSLVNVCAANMSLTAEGGKDGAGRHIGTMFRTQAEYLKGWKVDDIDVVAHDDVHATEENESVKKTTVQKFSEIWDAGEKRTSPHYSEADALQGSEDYHVATQESHLDDDDDDDDDDNHFFNPSIQPDFSDAEICPLCSASMPPFAMAAHERFHLLPD